MRPDFTSCCNCKGSFLSTSQGVLGQSTIMIRSGRLNDDPRENVHVTKLHEDVLNTKDKSFLAKIYGTSISNGPVKHVKSLEILKY